MRIVHLVIGGDVAGGQLVALQLARAARARGDEVGFVAPAAGAFVDEARAEGFPVALVDVGRTFRMRGLLRLVRLLRSFQADLLHTHTHAAANVLGRLAARLAGARVVSHLHIEGHFRPGAAGAPLRALDNATARLCSRCIAVSDDTRRAFERQGYPSRLIETVRNGIDVAAAAAAGRDGIRAELGVPEDAPLAGEVGRLCDVKGQRELVEAAAHVPGLHVVLVGADLEAGGAFQERLEREAEHFGVRDRIVFAGYRPDAAAILAVLDVFVLPSWIEGLPMTVLEAMAQRKPVVATPVGGTPEVVVDGETGVLVPPRDPAALAEAIQGLVSDRKRARSLGEAGYRRVAEEFDAETMAQRVLEIYDDVAGR